MPDYRGEEIEKRLVEGLDPTYYLNIFNFYHGNFFFFKAISDCIKCAILAGILES